MCSRGDYPKNFRYKAISRKNQFSMLNTSKQRAASALCALSFATHLQTHTHTKIPLMYNIIPIQIERQTDRHLTNITEKFNGITKRKRSRCNTRQQLLNLSTSLFHHSHTDFLLLTPPPNLFARPLFPINHHKRILYKKISK